MINFFFRSVINTIKKTERENRKKCYKVNQKYGISLILCNTCWNFSLAQFSFHSIRNNCSETLKKKKKSYAQRRHTVNLIFSHFHSHSLTRHIINYHFVLKNRNARNFYTRLLPYLDWGLFDDAKMHKTLRTIILTLLCVAPIERIL